MSLSNTIHRYVRRLIRWCNRPSDEERSWAITARRRAGENFADHPDENTRVFGGGDLKEISAVYFNNRTRS